jgi:hypothetical protein
MCRSIGDSHYPVPEWRAGLDCPRHSTRRRHHSVPPNRTGLPHVLRGVRRMGTDAPRRSDAFSSAAWRFPGSLGPAKPPLDSPPGGGDLDLPHSPLCPIELLRNSRQSQRIRVRVISPRPRTGLNSRPWARTFCDHAYSARASACVRMCACMCTTSTPAHMREDCVGRDSEHFSDEKV